MNGVEKLFQKLKEEKCIELLVDMFSEGECPSQYGLHDVMYVQPDGRRGWCENESEECDECWRSALKKTDY